MRLLKDFIHGFEFVKMKPTRDVIRDPLPKDARCQVLAELGQQYAAYFKGAPKFSFAIDLPAGNYQIQWLDVVTGRHAALIKRMHGGGPALFQIPEELNECALKVVR